MKLALALLLLAGCPRSAPTCGDAFAAFDDRLEVANADLYRSSGYERLLDAKYVTFVRDRCVEDGWGSAARKCVHASGSFRDFYACEKLLTDAQRLALARVN